MEGHVLRPAAAQVDCETEQSSSEAVSRAPRGTGGGGGGVYL